MKDDVELSVGLLPDNKNIYIVASGNKEFVINNGVTLRAIDANGERHDIGCTLSADYFFKLITNALDADYNKSGLAWLFKPSWGVGSEFSSAEMEKEEKKAWEEFKNNFLKNE